MSQALRVRKEISHSFNQQKLGNFKSHRVRGGQLRPWRTHKMVMVMVMVMVIVMVIVIVITLFKLTTDILTRTVFHYIADKCIAA